MEEPDVRCDSDRNAACPAVAAFMACTEIREATFSTSDNT